MTTEEAINEIILERSKLSFLEGAKIEEVNITTSRLSISTNRKGLDYFKTDIIIDGIQKSLFIKKGGDIKEYYAMKNLWGKVYTREMWNRIPEPFAYVSEERILISEFIEGNTLHSALIPLFFLGYNKFKRRRIVDFSEKIVDWLVTFEKSIFKDEHAQTSSLKNIGLEKLNNLDIPIDTKKGITRFVEKMALSEELIPVHFSNDGFRLKNLMDTGHGIVAVDWEVSLPYPCFIMMASLLRKLEQKTVYFVISNSATNFFIDSIKSSYLKKTFFMKYKRLFNLIYVLVLIDALHGARVILESDGRRQTKIREIFLKRIENLIAEG